MNIYNIRRIKKNRPKRYNVPDPYGFLVKKNSSGHWISSCFNEETQKKQNTIDAYQFIDNDDFVALQLGSEINWDDLEDFERSIGGTPLPVGEYIPCLINEKVMLVKSDFLQPIID